MWPISIVEILVDCLDSHFSCEDAQGLTGQVGLSQ